MLSRDLNALEEMGLIQQARRGQWQASKWQILAFRPLRLEGAAEEQEGATPVSLRSAEMGQDGLAAMRRDGRIPSDDPDSAPRHGLEAL